MAMEVPTISDEVKSRIFDGVVAIFNEALPDFLQKSVDPALQSRRIVESLDSSLNEYLDNVVFDAQRYAEGVLKHAAEEAKKQVIVHRLPKLHLLLVLLQIAL